MTANKPAMGSDPPYWRITIPALAVRYGIGGDPGARWLLDPESARRARSEGWAEYVPKLKRKAKGA